MPQRRRSRAARRTWGIGVVIMFGPQWALTKVASASGTASHSHSGVASRRLAKATPGWAGPAANSAGWSVTARTPSRTPAASSRTGRRARSTSVPAPTHLISAASRCSKVSSSASVPKSRAWLLASDTQSTPSRSSASVATGGARKKKGFFGSGQGVPRVEMQHSRFTMVRSASLQAATTSSRSEEHTSELQSRGHLVCRLLLEKKKNQKVHPTIHPMQLRCEYVDELTHAVIISASNQECLTRPFESALTYVRNANDTTLFIYH